MAILFGGIYVIVALFILWIVLLIATCKADGASAKFINSPIPFISVLCLEVYGFYWLFLK